MLLTKFGMLECHKLKAYVVRGSFLSIVDYFLQDGQSSTPNQLWEPLFCCTSMACLMEPFQELDSI